MACGNYSLVSIASNNCLDSTGGIKKVYAIEYDSVKAALGSVENANMIDTLTMSGDTKWKVFNFRKGTGSIVSAAEINEQNGTLAFKTDVTLKFNHPNDIVRSSIMALVMEGAAVIVQDSMNNYFYLGADYPVTASAAGQESGTAFSDFSGYTTTITDNSRELPRLLTEKAVGELEAALEPKGAKVIA